MRNMKPAPSRAGPRHLLKFAGSPDAKPVPWDGVSSGEIEIRGLWGARNITSPPSHRWTDDGWFKTGDVATMDEDGYVISTVPNREVWWRMDQFGGSRKHINGSSRH